VSVGTRPRIRCSSLRQYSAWSCSRDIILNRRVDSSRAEFDGKLVSIPGIRASTLRCLSMSALLGRRCQQFQHFRAFIPRVQGTAVTDHAVKQHSSARGMQRAKQGDRGLLTYAESVCCHRFSNTSGVCSAGQRRVEQNRFSLRFSAVICSLVRIYDFPSPELW